MAVYTKLNKENIEEIRANYSIGQLGEFRGIEDGIENTNYFLLVNNKKYILTIYEKRVKEKDLPFFSNLMTGLNKQDFKCPVPIKNKNNKYMASDCPLAGKHLKQLETDTNITNDEALHPIELIAKSYRL